MVGGGQKLVDFALWVIPKVWPEAAPIVALIKQGEESVGGVDQLMPLLADAKPLIEDIGKLVAKHQAAGATPVQAVQNVRRDVGMLHAESFDEEQARLARASAVT